MERSSVKAAERQAFKAKFWSLRPFSFPVSYEYVLMAAKPLTARNGTFVSLAAVMPLDLGNCLLTDRGELLRGM
jgi:hypothetical protein